MQHLQDEEVADTADGNDVSELSADDLLIHSITYTSLAAIAGVLIATGVTKISPKKITTRDHHGTNTSNSRKPISPEQ